MAAAALHSGAAIIVTFNLSNKAFVAFVCLTFPFRHLFHKSIDFHLVFCVIMLNREMANVVVIEIKGLEDGKFAALRIEADVVYSCGRDAFGE